MAGFWFWSHFFGLFMDTVYVLLYKHPQKRTSLDSVSVDKHAKTNMANNE